MGIAEWLAVIGILQGVLAAVFGFALPLILKINSGMAKLETMAESNKADHDALWEEIDSHAGKIGKNTSDIAVLQAKVRKCHGES